MEQMVIHSGIILEFKIQERIKHTE
jgi:hypothetical protein